MNASDNTEHETWPWGSAEHLEIWQINLEHVDKVLDDSESRRPCGDWRGGKGTRQYSAKRVRQAQTMQVVDGIYRHPDADEINQCDRPCTPPIMVVDYLVPLKHIDENLFYKLRPKWGPSHATPILVEESLSTLIRFADNGTVLNSRREIDAWFDQRSETAADRLGDPWPDVICREVRLKTYIPRAKSKRTVSRILDSFSLIHAAKVPIVLGWKEPEGIVDLLVAAPTIRFDPVVQKPKSKKSLGKD
jgi:hypothetical protein